ncbi:MAG: hypothetical protein ACRDK3_07565 [Actinomycetota bacterium]
MGVAGKLMRTARRYRRWWPPGLAVAGALVVALLVELRGEGDDQGVAGPLVAVSLLTGLIGLATGVGEGLVRPPASIELRIEIVLVVVALVTAATLRGGPLVAGLAALTGTVVALGLRWCGRRVMQGMLGREDGDEP